MKFRGLVSLFFPLALLAQSPVPVRIAGTPHAPAEYLFGKLQQPSALAFDARGNLYIADAGAHVVYRVTRALEISIFASGLGAPCSLAFDRAGNLFIADRGTNLIVRITPDGTASTFAGLLLSSRPEFIPISIAFDAAGVLYVADLLNTVRAIGLDGSMLVIAGTGKRGLDGDGGPAIQATLADPSGIAVDTSGNIFVASGDRVRRIGRDGIINTVPGLGGGYSGGTPWEREGVPSQTGMKFDAAGNLYVTDKVYNRILKRAVDGTVTAIAGSGEYGFSEACGDPQRAKMRAPSDVALDAAGNVYIADQNNGRVRVLQVGNVIRTYFGPGSVDIGGDRGFALNATFGKPQGLALDATGNLYVADAVANRVRRIDSAGYISTVAGGDVPVGCGDGDSRAFSGPTAVAVGVEGTLYVADTGNHRVIAVSPDGPHRILAGVGDPGFSGDGGPANLAKLSSPQGVMAHPDGSVWIADSGNSRVRIVSKDGTISTFAALTGLRSLLYTHFGTILIGADFGVLKVADIGLLPAAGSSEYFPTPIGPFFFGSFDRLEEIGSANAIAVDGPGTIFVADTLKGVVQSTSPRCAIAQVDTTKIAAAGLASDGTNLFFSDPSGAIWKVTPPAPAETPTPYIGRSGVRSAQDPQIGYVELMAHGQVVARVPQSLPVWPGEALQITGACLGPSVPQTPTVLDTTTAAGTRVLFNGKAAAISTAQFGRVLVTTPSDLPIGSTVEITVEFNGGRNSVTLPVVHPPN